ncbi:hypothetical protein [Natrarchaeobaculum aegyptiacum]|uniref:Uncharacterized protein n=1 Tax=Natrarchaeobaculum aegyptiacum TaxID=745377 RepID=A0A2Z2HR50_9EURY|nr:hypothetical protein [Natrarchaeobaculum aegyptiacum]ARS89502.1 hypothetical protein B1756_06910 [Natrarchaeobaculum aegyptiacum]
MRRSIVVAAALLAIAFLFVGGPSLLFSPSADELAPEETDDPEPELVSFDGVDSGFWPYLNAREAHEKRSPLNVVVRGDANETLWLLAEHGDGDWEEADHDHFEAEELLDFSGNDTDSAMDPDIDPDEANTTIEEHRPIEPTEIPWSEADGATRYAYLDPGPDEDAYWTTETLQLEDGEYYGYRYHVRMYESPNPDDEWVVMQTHSEHFDWFTLRHRVDGVEQAQARLEADLMAIPGVDVQENVQRIFLDNRGPSDADGWATKVDLTAMAVLPLALGLAARRNRGRTRDGSSGRGQYARAETGGGALGRIGNPVDDRLTEYDRERLAAIAERIEVGHLLLVVTIFAVILGVRAGGILLDNTVDTLTVHMIAALLYPIIAIGLPVATYTIANGLERRMDAALVASTSLAAAIWVDYSVMGVDVLPVDVVFQRALVVVALGLIAAGAANRATRGSRFNDMEIAGAGLWALVLVATLLGYL